MRQHNAENERVKREYLIYLKAAKGLSEASLDTVVKAIHRFEVSTKFRSLRKFHVAQAFAFRRQLSETDSSETGKPLSKATVLQTLTALRAFFLWLAADNRATGRGSAIQTLIISDFQRRTRGSPKPGASGRCRLWSKSGACSPSCRTPPRSIGATVP
jgi:hypothetical protein